MSDEVDIRENDILRRDSSLLEELLIDYNNILLANQYKIMIGQLNPDRGGVSNTSEGSNVTTRVSILMPGEVTTASYLILGGFNTLEEAESYASYIRTKFVRFLILQTLSSMHITQANFQFVPVQDWSHPWTDEAPMTLAQFTAKYMPRNSRSISGLCQGPKYFTYKGVSLYKLKDSFLGSSK